MIHTDNAVTELADAVVRIGRHRWPIRRTKTVERFLADLSQAYGLELREDDTEAILAKLGTLGMLVGATLQNTANPSMLEAGYKVNVIPTEAEAHVDGRFLPGYEAEFDETIRSLVGEHIDIETLNDDVAVETSFETTTFELMASVLRHEDPAARAVPYMISGGTDAKALSSLGIACYGFSPLRMPENLDYWRLISRRRRASADRWAHVRCAHAAQILDGLLTLAMRYASHGRSAGGDGSDVCHHGKCVSGRAPIGRFRRWR